MSTRCSMKRDTGKRSSWEHPSRVGHVEKEAVFSLVIGRQITDLPSPHLWASPLSGGIFCHGLAQPVTCLPTFYIQVDFDSKKTLKNCLQLRLRFWKTEKTYMAEIRILCRELYARCASSSCWFLGKINGCQNCSLWGIFVGENSSFCVDFGLFRSNERFSS